MAGNNQDPLASLTPPVEAPAAPASPIPQPAAAPAESPEDNVEDFASLADFLDRGGEEAEPAENPPVEKPGVPPAEPAVKPAEPPAVPAPAEPPVAAQPPVQPPAPPVEPPAQPVPQPPAEVPLTAEQVRAKRDAVVESIASKYSFTEQEAAQLATEPEKILPKMVGRLFVDVYDAVAASMAQVVPNLVHQYVTARQVEQSNEEAFFKRWPSLKDQKYYPVIRQAATIYRQMNPNATLEDIVEKTGAMTMASLGLQPQPPAAAPTPQPVRTTPSRPFVPASPGGVAPVPASIDRPRNEFEELALYEEKLD